MHFRGQKKTLGDVSLSDYIETGSDGSPLSFMDVICSQEDLAEQYTERETVEKLHRAVGLALDLAGSIISAYAPEGDDTMFYTGAGCIIAGATIVLAAAIPTVFVGYARMNKGIDQFNMAQASAKPQAYWTIQGSQNGVGLALHF
jgi:hypothetical protein